jgi:cyclohexadieny/prephenate dehydrogenase
MFDRVAIIGCGLIGSSVLRRLKKNGSIKKLVTYDNDKSVTNIIKKENLSDEIALSSSEAVKNSDLVLISTPMRSFESVINSIQYSKKNKFKKFYLDSRSSCCRYREKWS